MAELPNLPLIQERFLNSIQPVLQQNSVRYPTFEIIAVFAQTWGSTALGFGGIGGCAMTKAYTTVILNEDLGCVGVFFGERLAYIIQHPNEKFVADLRNRNLCCVSEHRQYEKLQ